MQTKSQANLLELAFTSTSTKSPSGTGINNVSELGFARRIKQRAEILGIKETRFYWIAEESLNVPLEVNMPWEQGTNEDGIPFYYNHDTQESVWEHPALAPHREIYEMEKRKYKEQQLQEAREENAKEAQLLNDLNDKINEIKANDGRGKSEDGMLALATGDSPSKQNSSAIGDRNFGRIVESAEPSIVSSSSSDSDDSPDNTDVIMDKVAGNSKLVKELQEQYREEDVAYWRSQYDELLVEKNRLDRQLLRMEHVMQKSVIEQSKLHDERYRLQTYTEDCLSKLTEAGDKALKYLHERGFHSSGKLRKHKIDADEPDHIPTLLSAIQDTVVIFDLYVKVMNSTPLDDAGYSKTWDGAIKRVLNELGNCFIYDGPNGRHIETDTTTLQFRLEELTSSICSYGEYLTDNSQRQEYIERMMRHVAKFAPGDTPVPLELITATINKMDAEEKADLIEYKPVDVNTPSLYMDMAPHTVMKMKKDLLENQATITALEDTLEKKTTQIEAILTQLDTANRRLEERKLFDENLNNKFEILNRELSEVKQLQSLQVAGIEGSRSSDANSPNGNSGGAADNKVRVSLNQEILQLKSKLTDIQEELSTSNRRADQGEERTEKLFHELENLQRISNGKDVSHQLAMSKLRARCNELKEANSEQKQVAEGIYAELNKTLVLCSSLEKDRNDLKIQLEMMKGGEVHVQKLKDRIADEIRHSESLMQKNNALADEIKVLNAQIIKLHEKNTHSKGLVNNISVNLREKSADAKRYLDNLDQLSMEKSQLMSSLTNLKKQYIRVNDQLIDVQGSIRVFCRVRPILPHDLMLQSQQQNSQQCMNSSSSSSFGYSRSMNNISSSNSNGHGYSEYSGFTTEQELNSLIKYIDYNVVEYNHQMFEYDRIFTPQDSQEEVYDEVEAVVRSAINGQNACILGYGQTGSGKTHTVIGDAGDSGLSLRTFKTIFTSAEQEFNDFGVVTEVSMSMFEIYNDEVYDLLDTSQKVVDPKNPNAGAKTALEVRQARNGSVYVDKLSEYSVKNVTEVSTLLNLGGNKRAEGSSGEDPQEHNARSHLLIGIKIQRTNSLSKQVTSGSIYIGDLAGCERTNLTSASGQRLREAQHVNKSLSALSDVITGLSNRQKPTSIPYRASKLTHVLQDCLKANSSRILMFVNIHPLPMFKAESIHSLSFGIKCRTVQLGPVKRNIAYTA